MTRAITDHVKSFPNQNFGELEGRLATRSPGSQTTQISHYKDTEGGTAETNWINMGYELRVGKPEAAMGHKTLHARGEGE